MPVGFVKGGLKAGIINNLLKDIPKRKGKLSAESLNDVSDRVLYVMMHGDVRELGKLLPRNQPLYFLSDKEILLYAKIKKIKGKLEEKKRKENSKIRKVDGFIKEIEKKNPDIRHNVVNALLKI